MKISEASQHEQGVDMISNLPDHVIVFILSHIPTTEEVIQLSILSRRWRYVWTSIPSIDVDCSRGLEFEWNPSQRTTFKKFMYRILENSSLDLDSFRLCCDDYYSTSTVTRWVNSAVMRKVKVVDLKFSPMGWSFDIEMPRCLVTCGSLEVLKLSLYGCSLSLPKFTGFQALRVLKLKRVELFDDKLVKCFLESCPLLEDLTLIECLTNKSHLFGISSPNLKNLKIENWERTGGYEVTHYNYYNARICPKLQISCPKLVFLELIGYVALEIFFENLYSLKKAVTYPKYLFEVDAPPSDLFANISHMEYLSTSFYFIRQCFDRTVIDLDRTVIAPMSLPNLKTLWLTVDDMYMNELIHFLTSLPNLESLHLIIHKNAYWVGCWNLEEVETMGILTRHLKTVKFLEFDGEKHKVVLVRALMEHGNALEEMVFSWSTKALFHERSMETLKEVSNFYAASLSVKLRGLIE